MDASNSPRPIKHNDLMRRLAASLRANNDRMVWEDMQLGPQGSPRPDVYTILKSYTRPLPTAYECKVSVSDFRSDVTSGKWQEYLRFAGAVIFCTPSGLVQKDEVPQGCGLIWLYPDTGTFRTVRAATYRAVVLPQDAMIKLLIDGVRRAGEPARAAEKRDFNVMKRVREKVGAEVADFLRNKEEALSLLAALEQRVKALEEQRDDISKFCREREEEACRRGSEQAALKEAQANALLGELKEGLGLPFDANIWKVRATVSALRDKLHEDTEVRRLSEVIARIGRLINEAAEHPASTVSKVAV